MTQFPLYQLMSDEGVVIDRHEHELTAEIAGPRTAHLLDTAIGAPLIRVNRVAIVADWRAPSDMSARIWLDEIEREVPEA